MIFCISILFLCAFAINPSEEVIKDGYCPRLAHFPFSISLFKGKWYHIAFTPESIENLSCISTEIIYNSSFLSADVSYKYINRGRIYFHKKGQIEDIQKNELLVSIIGLRPRKYYVVATDYTCYAILFSCEPMPGSVHRPRSNVNCWIWSRFRELPTGIRAVVNSTLHLRGLDFCHEFLQEHDQIDCP